MPWCFKHQGITSCNTDSIFFVLISFVQIILFEYEHISDLFWNENEPVVKGLTDGVLADVASL